MEKLLKYSGLVSLVAIIVLTVVMFTYGVPVRQDGVLGVKQSASKFTNVEVTNELQTADLTVTDDVAITDDVSVGGDLDITGSLQSLKNVTVVANTATTTVSSTLSASNAMTTYFVSSVSSTEYYLPATSSASGLTYRFVVGGALTGDLVIKSNGGANVIEGTLIVAGAVVDCDAEDTITFVSDGENIGDYVELYSDGTYWYIGDSGALTASKLTCSAT